MSNKQKKKRNKVYRGADAAITRPAVTRITAVKRTKLGQWWFDHKRIAKPVIIVAVVVAVIIVMIAQIISLAS